MEISRDLDLLIAVVVAIVGVGGFLLVGNVVLRILVLAVCLAAAAYIAGLVGPFDFRV